MEIAFNFIVLYSSFGLNFMLDQKTYMHSGGKDASVQGNEGCDPNKLEELFVWWNVVRCRVYNTVTWQRKRVFRSFNFKYSFAYLLLFFLHFSLFKKENIFYRRNE